MVAISPVYETEPVGGPPQPDYLNAVVAVETALSPGSCSAWPRHSRPRPAGTPRRRERWGPRPLDIDVLMVGESGSTSPTSSCRTPGSHQRTFVLAPLADVAPELVVAPSAGWQGVRRAPYNWSCQASSTA